jgi:sensor histidine kinase YesM
VEAKGHGIGLQNIHKRVQLRFSEAYGLQIRRENGKTQIQVRVPYAPKQ